jgi:hypothetical protein
VSQAPPQASPTLETYFGFLRRLADAGFEVELQSQFESALNARERLGPVVRYLDVLGSATLPTGLAEKLIPRARELADFRMLAHRIPLELSHALQIRPASDECRQAVERVLATRLQSKPDPA